MLEILKRSLPSNFNDFLCLFLMGAILTMWFLDGLDFMKLNLEVLGSTIAFFTLVGQYYFRKKQTEAEK